MRPLLLLSFSALVLVTWGASAAAAPKANYIGVDGCTRACHKVERDGDQRSVWLKSKHAKAFNSLGSAEAKQKAAQLGVAGDPQQAEACLVCHTTGFGEPSDRFDKKFNIADGVQCEACHGPGENYRKKATMKKMNDERGPDRKGVSATAKEFGLIYPTDKDCKRCHVPEIDLNGKVFKNPTHKDFDFKKYFDKMKHPIPS